MSDTSTSKHWLLNSNIYTEYSLTFDHLKAEKHIRIRPTQTDSMGVVESLLLAADVLRNT